MDVDDLHEAMIADLHGLVNWSGQSGRPRRDPRPATTGLRAHPGSVRSKTTTRQIIVVAVERRRKPCRASTLSIAFEWWMYVRKLLRVSRRNAL
jgi:hypothetical protein